MKWFRRKIVSSWSCFVVKWCFFYKIFLYQRRGNTKMISSPKTDKIRMESGGLDATPKFFASYNVNSPYIASHSYGCHPHILILDYKVGVLPPVTQGASPAPSPAHISPQPHSAPPQPHRAPLESHRVPPQSHRPTPRPHRDLNDPSLPRSLINENYNLRAGTCHLFLRR